MKRMQSAILTSACVLALSNAGQAQESASGQAQPNRLASAGSTGLEEIIVTARRKEERLEDVPSTVNVATAEELNKLNIRSFTDVATIMPGLSLSGTNVVNATSSVRGISFNQVVSGNSGVIEFYLNDSPIPATLLYQVMYDVGQVELLRGPQGTLRGRAAPAGSMTVTTRRPDLSEFGAYVDATATDIGGRNINAAINFPLATDMLALRFAALYDESEGDRVTSVNNASKPFNRTKSGRATLRFEPLSNLSFLVSFQTLDNSRRTYAQVENLRVADPNAPLAAKPIAPAPLPPVIPMPGSPSNFFIKADDRLAVQDTPANPTQQIDVFNIQGEWSFLGQRLSYVGSTNHTTAEALDVLDAGDFFGPADPKAFQGYGRTTSTVVKGQAHELRFSSDERLFGTLDYIVGAFYEQQESPTSFTQATFLYIPPAGPGSAVYTPLNRINFTKEQSYFANLTAHFGTGTEISGGFRHLDYKADAGLLVNGAPLAALDQHDKFSTNIYQGSIKQRFNDDLMVYGTVGTSWRPGVTVVGDFNTAPSALEQSFQHLPPETSTSYEIGIKASALDQRMRANLAIYHQTYENSPWRSPSPVYYVNTAAPGAPPTPGAFNLAGAVPITINGVEGELSFAPIKSWDFSVNASYVKSKIDNGLVPCNDYLPHDGIPDTGSGTPTLAQIQAAAAPETITGCRVSYRASQSPPFSGTIQSEYRMPISANLGGYVRGLLSYYGDSQNDPTNPIDDVDSYALLNVYLGIRSTGGAWEVGLYGKNVTDTQRTIFRTQIPLGGGFLVPYAAPPTQPASVSYSTNYRAVGVLAPREFGINVRWSFGAR